MHDEEILMMIKLAHTVIWAVMAMAIVGVPIAAVLGRIRLSAANVRLMVESAMPASWRQTM